MRIAKTISCALCWAGVVLCGLTAMAGQADTIWREGENHDGANVVGHNWYNSVKKSSLSGNEWISHYTKQRAGTVRYEIDVRVADTYTLWVRANPLRSRTSRQLDGGAWHVLDFSKSNVRGRMNIAANNQPDMRFIAWVKGGTVALSKGSHTLTFRFDSKLYNHGAIDAFVLTRIPFVPSGTRKPTVQTGGAEPDAWFPVIPQEDDFSDTSVIDISHLIESHAGKHGVLKNRDGRLFFEDGTGPVKFWGINANLASTSTVEEMKQRAKWYRKLGINIVRQHTVLGAVGLLNRNGQFNQQALDRYDRWFAELKNEGIYTTWSVIYPHHQPLVQQFDEVGRKKLTALDQSDSRHDLWDGQAVTVNDFINLDRELQDLALTYFRKLLEHSNPYTGMKYKHDPALAVVEFQNESNVFFHTLNSLRNKNVPHFSDYLRHRFYQWVVRKYGSETAVAAAWNEKWDKNDDWANERLGLMAPYHWGSAGPKYEYKGQRQRAADYIRFLGELQRDYYKRRYRELRRIGYNGQLVTTAWKGVGFGSLPNLWADTVGDVIDRHNYAGGGAGRHRIQEGPVDNGTHLGFPGRHLLNLGLFQVTGKPFSVSEWSMTPPSPWKAEAAPLYAFYGMGLQGWDFSYHFATDASRLGDGWPALSKYVSHTPHYMGQFPALAFALYNNHIQEAPVVAQRKVTPNQIFSSHDVLGQSIGHGSHDRKLLGRTVKTPPETMAIGRVTLAFGEEARTIQKDLSSYRDREQKRLTSITGQLVWDYDNRYVEIRSEKTQGLLGFTGGGSYDLPDVNIDMRTPFASLIFTPMDNRPLAVSKQILITAMARDKQRGAEFNRDWSQLTAIGSPPLMMEPVQATILLAGNKPKYVTTLDIYGVPTGNTVAVEADGRFDINGSYQTYYYYVVR